MDQKQRELSYGEQYVGLKFNPSGSKQVDILHDIALAANSLEQVALCEFSINQILLGQMAAVKAATKGL